MNVYLARQPIFNKKREVVAYELLFRSTDKNAFDNSDSTDATLQVVKNSFSLFSTDSLVGDKKAFLNFDENLINSDIMDLFSPNLVVIEVLETVELTPDIIDSIKRIKSKGFKIALDDFIYKEEYNQIISSIDFIKVDFLQTLYLERKKIVDKFKDTNIKFLAEKVETEEDFNSAIEYGYTLFQGYYLSKPTVVSTKDLFTDKYNYFNALEELNKKTVNIEKVEASIKRDLALSYKLLRLINSVFYGIRTEVTSIRQAVMLIGINNLKKWLYVITLKSLTDEHMEAIVTTSLLRARFGELLAERSSFELKAFDMFLIGLFSMVDRFVDMSMGDILKELPVTNDVKKALSGDDSIYSHILNIIKEYEAGNWTAVDKNLAFVKLTGADIYNCYLEALDWVGKINI
ncbi:MAG: EAL and HDOD domain-containing protein [Solirubrobacterales bacterium]